MDVKANFITFLEQTLAHVKLDKVQILSDSVGNINIGFDEVVLPGESFKKHEPNGTMLITLHLHTYNPDSDKIGRGKNGSVPS